MTKSEIARALELATTKDLAGALAKKANSENTWQRTPPKLERCPKCKAMINARQRRKKCPHV